MRFDGRSCVGPDDDGRVSGRGASEPIRAESERSDRRGLGGHFHPTSTFGPETSTNEITDLLGHFHRAKKHFHATSTATSTGSGRRNVTNVARLKFVRGQKRVICFQKGALGLALAVEVHRKLTCAHDFRADRPRQRVALVPNRLAPVPPGQRSVQEVPIL